MEIDLRDFLRDRDQKIRAEVAEGIARAIEAEQVKCYPGSPRDKVWASAAAIARNYTATATGTPTSDAPAPQLPAPGRETGATPSVAPAQPTVGEH